MMGQTFDAQAVKAFADGLSSLTGIDVKVQVRGERAFTDGSTIVLPSNGGIWAEEDFQVLCGTGCHEVGHVYFKSPAEQEKFALGFPESDRPRASIAYNAAIDVADEARFEKIFPHAGFLFDRLRAASVRQAIAAGTIPGRPPKEGISLPGFAATAINLARSRPRSEVRKLLRGWQKRVKGLHRACSILGRIRERRADPVRDSKEWDRLSKRARELFDLLGDLYPEREGAGASDGPPTAASGGADAQGDWLRSLLAKAGGRAAVLEEEGGVAASEDWQEAWGGSFGSGGMDWILKSLQDDSIVLEESAYAEVFPAFRRTAAILATGPEQTYESGHTTGSRMSQPCRAFTDGRCFGRVISEKGVEGAFAILFDHSGSMASSLGVFLPVGMALSDSLSAIHGLEVAIWRFGTWVERIERSDDLRTPRLLGGTRTDLALTAARLWLEKQEASQKTVILFTDGAPDSDEATARECAGLRRFGARIIVGSLGMGLDLCAKKMPGAAVFNVDPRNAGSSLHVVIRRLLG